MSKHTILSRRAFLAAAGGAAAGLALPRWFARANALEGAPASATQIDYDSPEWAFIQPDPVQFEEWGRITHYGAIVRGAPDPAEPVADFVALNVVFPVFEKMHTKGTAGNPNNTLWYRTTQGYIYTASVQPMKAYRMPAELSQVTALIGEEPGVWAETIVPYTVARTEPSGATARTDNDEAVVHYFASVHRVIGVQPDQGGYRWYKVFDDKPKSKPVWALARHMRIFAPEEFAPINPGANKKLVADLKAQRIDCFEDDQLVFSTLMSSGAAGYDTPKGDHAVVFKQASRHMYSDPEQEAFSDPDFFDLPGVPFNIFFTTMGHAIHGTYWHGDYGRPRSHGCLNVTPEAAKWMFRWLEPVSPYEVLSSGSASEPGTPVIVT